MLMPRVRLQLRVGGGRDNGYAALRQGQQVGHGDSVQEIQVFRTFLPVDDQIEHDLAHRSDGEKLLAVCIGGVGHHHPCAVRG